MKKKIKDTIEQFRQYQNRDMNGHIIWLENDTDKLAQALISAGIGDVEEAERKAFIFKNELAQTIHREEVAKRALYIAATQLKCRGGIGKGFCRVDECDYYNCNNYGGCVKAHLKQAEKELSEKRKDE